MPSMEVFTISGSSFGESAAPPVLLQNALKALGTAHGDPPLTAVTVDGVIGPKTVVAVNYALKTYIGAGPVRGANLSGRFLNATATKSDVQQYAGTLAALVTGAVRNAGGTIPDPVVTKRSSVSKTSKTSFAPTDVTPAADHSMMNPNLVWVGTGVAIVVVALGFLAARRRAAA